MDPIIAIPIAVALCILAALCSAAEGALQALSRSEMHDIAQETTRSPQRIQAIGDEFRRHLDSLVLCQVGCLSAVGVLLALLVNEVWHRPWLAALAASVALLIVHVLFIGSFPRTVGAYRPRATVIVLSRLIRLVHAALGWVNTLRTMLGDVFISAPASTTTALASEEQLLSMVDEAAEQDVLDLRDRDRIHSLLGFSDRMVREVMVPRTDMRTVDSGVSVVEATRELLEQGISRAPIVGRDSDDIRGVAYLKDLAKAMTIGDGRKMRVDNVARPAVFVPETLRGDALLQRMQQDATHFAIVVDEYGGVAGLVTLEDLIEELVGDISDEHDRVDNSWEVLDDGSIRVATRMPISELEELLDTTFDHEDVDSVGGLFTSALDRIPVLTDRGRVGEFVFASDRVGRKHHVTHVRILRVDGTAVEVTMNERERRDQRHYS